MLDYRSIYNKATKMEIKEALSYIETLLSGNPLFSLYKNLIDADMQVEKELLLDEFINYPILAKAKATKDEELSYLLFKSVIDSDYSDDKKLEAYKRLIRLANDENELKMFYKAIYDITLDKYDLYNYGSCLFDLNEYDNAYIALKDSMPYSSLYLYKCYVDGLGVKKSSLDAFNTLSKGILAGDIYAKDEMNEFLLKHLEYSKKANEVFYRYNEENDFSPYVKKALFKEAINEPFLTEEEIKSLFANFSNNLKYDRAKKLLEDYDYIVIDNSEDDKLNTLEKLVKVLDLINKQKFNYEFNFINNYRLEKKWIEFFLDGYEDAKFSPGVFKHSPSEAAILLNTKRDEAIIRFDRLKQFLYRPSNKKFLNYLLYLFSKYDSTNNEPSNKEMEVLIYLDNNA